MESSSNSFESILDNAGDYFETKVDLFKLQAVDRSSGMLSSLSSILVIGMVVLLSVFTINIGLALWIGSLLGSTYYGFFVLGGFYAVIGLVIYLCRNSWIKTPVTNAIISKMIN